MSSDRRERAARAEQMRKEREKADRRQRNLITVAIVGVVIVLVAVGGYAIKNSGGDDDQPVVAPSGVTKDFGVNYTAVDAGGKAGAKPVTVAIYEDFQCPFCKAFEAADDDFLVKEVKSGAITITYHPISILDSGANDQYSTRAASAAMCVLNEGGVTAYKKMHDLLYAHQPPESGPSLDANALTTLAKQAGVSGLGTCITSTEYGSWIGSATKHAGVGSTPTVRVNGKDLLAAGGGVPQVADLQKAIDAAS